MGRIPPSWQLRRLCSKPTRQIVVGGPAPPLRSHTHCPQEKPVSEPILSSKWMSTSRRAAMALAFGAAVLSSSAWAQQPAPAPAAPEDISKPGELADIILGKPDAPVTIVEYASMTCPHCATFHKAVLPTLKEKYIDTGKVRLIFREFPLDNLAAAASMLGRCTGGEKTAPLISMFFEKQEEWAFVKGSPLPALLKLAETAGFTKESFDKCLNDQKLLDGIVAVGERGRKVFGVTSTPTFFVNGTKLDGRSDQITTFDKALEPLLK